MMIETVPVITIDGPTGSGKGTISRRLARELDWQLLDSGALYRLVALVAANKSIDFTDERRLAAAAAEMAVNFSSAADEEQIFLDGAEVTAQLRTEERGASASIVAALPRVRQALLERQRNIATAPGLIADGRDMGTVVFPNAILKVFLTASPMERARRRYNQLKDKGIDVSLPGLSREITERDERDANRKVAPLLPAADSRSLDSTGMTPDDVVRQIRRWLSELREPAN
jgi:cytidylate kinase